MNNFDISASHYSIVEQINRIIKKDSSEKQQNSLFYGNILN